MTSWISFVIHALGGTVFWVKFFPAAFGAMTMVLSVEGIAGVEIVGDLIVEVGSAENHRVKRNRL